MKRKGSPKANAEIARIVEKNIDLNTALALFEALSKVGGRGFRSRMERVVQVVQKSKAKSKKKPKSKKEDIGVGG
jgi:hypothetical protein